MNLERQIPQDAPVRLLAEIPDQMNYGKLERATAKEGKNGSIPARVKFGILVFGAMNDTYSSRKLEISCRYDVRYMWLLEGHAAPDHSTLSRFRSGPLMEAIDDLFRQLMAYLAERGELDYGHLFVDGTKLEAYANRYTFVWRKSVEKRLAKLREKAAVLLGQSLEQVSLEAVCRAHAAQKRLCRELGIPFVSGKGKRKSLEQKRCEQLQEIVSKWEEYERHLEIMGPGRNSYSKTDHDATFMRMKDDHMRNAQLKPGYNVQVGVSSAYIVGIQAFPNRSDSGTFIPFLENLGQIHGRKFSSVTTDAGYESLENYRYLEENGQTCFIKPSNYESSKKKNKNWLGRREDMHYAPQQDAYICHGGMILWPVGERRRKSETGFVSNSTIYGCEDCTGCTLRSKCSKAKENKRLEVNRDFVHLRENSLGNITSETGITLRINRSIMSEGAFGIIKEDRAFRRFLLRGKRKILVELILLAFAFDIRKLHARMLSNRAGSQLFEVKIA